MVVKDKGPSLLGRNWLTKFCLNWQKIFSVQTNHFLDSLLKQYEDLFKEIKAKLHIDPQVKILFYKAHTVSFVLCEKVEQEVQRLEKQDITVSFVLCKKVEQELQRLEKQDIITPVTFVDWVAPIVPVEKCDSHVRVCRDYKLSVNKVGKTKCTRYPRPKKCSH